MMSKLFTLTALALALGVSAAPTLEERATATENTGILLAYSNTGYGDPHYLLDVAQGATTFCQEWADINNNNAALPTIKSYLATNITCFTWATKNCAGNANGYLVDGAYSNVNKPFNSLWCEFATT